MILLETLCLFFFVINFSCDFVFLCKILKKTFCHFSVFSNSFFEKYLVSFVSISSRLFKKTKTPHKSSQFSLRFLFSSSSSSSWFVLSLCALSLCLHSLLLLFLSCSRHFYSLFYHHAFSPFFLSLHVSSPYVHLLSLSLSHVDLFSLVFLLFVFFFFFLLNSFFFESLFSIKENISFFHLFIPFCKALFSISFFCFVFFLLFFQTCSCEQEKLTSFCKENAFSFQEFIFWISVIWIF